MEAVEDAQPYGVAGWNRHLGSVADGWRDKDYVLLAALFRLDHLEGSLLDVGCAVGDGFPVLQRSCPRVDSLGGCDFSSKGVATARRRFGAVDAFVHDVHEPLPSQWDNIVCLQTLEHLPDPVAAIANLVAATRRSLIVATPYRNRRPDTDHRWSFDEGDFADVFDGFVLDPARRNIFWYVTDDRSLVRPERLVKALLGWRGVQRRARLVLGR